MKSILQSIKPQYCKLIANGKKTVEVRKTRPKLNVPFKVYIYCTKGNTHLLLLTYSQGELTDSDIWQIGNGKVIGEYVCDKIEPKYCANGIATYYENEQGTCLSDAELQMYADGVKPLYFWHISNLKIYEKPKELSEFHKPCKCLDEYEGEVYCDCLNCEDAGDSDYGIIACDRTITRPPQSWCYVEEV